jgi:hypothetical protein
VVFSTHAHWIYMELDGNLVAGCISTTVNNSIAKGQTLNALTLELADVLRGRCIFTGQILEVRKNRNQRCCDRQLLTYRAIPTGGVAIGRGPNAVRAKVDTIHPHGWPYSMSLGNGNCKEQCRNHGEQVFHGQSRPCRSCVVIQVSEGY